VFDADLWAEEPLLLRAFATLFAARRVLPPPAAAQGAPTTSLAGLFDRSAAAQAEITDTLGRQVRQAVELLVGELARLDREAAGALLREVAEHDIYRAALTVMMRLVFLLYAEEQRLLPIAAGTYAAGYAVSTLYAQLEAQRGGYGDEVADTRSSAWPRLLATFAAVHGGCEHPDMRIPAHGGFLFDPSRYPWLPRAAVTDRVVRQILDALLVLRRGGKAAERLSYQGLDVEQVGHVYESLLEYSCLRVAQPYVGLLGKLEAELPLAAVEDARAAGRAPFLAWLKDRCDATPRQLERALAAEPGPADLAALAERARPFWGLLRADLRGAPTVFPAGSVLLTQVGDRRAEAARDKHPAKIAANIADPGAARAVQRANRRLPQMLLRLIASNAEQWLSRQLNAALDAPDECRSITRTLIRGHDGVITCTPQAITATLDRPASPRVAAALQTLLHQVNADPPHLPGDPRPITYTIAA
jgi:hypothetical protein